MQLPQRLEVPSLRSVKQRVVRHFAQLGAALHVGRNRALALELQRVKLARVRVEFARVDRGALLGGDRRGECGVGCGVRMVG